MKEIIKKLESGNKSFIAGETLKPKYCEKRSTDDQKPDAVVITCSDSRVPAELIFHVNIGDLFVIRNAGNVVSPSVLASVQYAVEHLKVQTVIVMGHTSCGAIEAIDKLDSLSGGLKDYINELSLELSGCCNSTESAHENVRVQAEKIRSQNFDCKVYEAMYIMESGVVELH